MLVYLNAAAPFTPSVQAEILFLNQVILFYFSNKRKNPQGWFSALRTQENP